MKLIIYLILISSTISYAKPYTFKWAILEKLTHQITIAKQFAKEMKSYDINVEIELFSELDQSKFLNSTSKDGFQITQNLSGTLIDRAPSLKVWDVPFLFRSSKHIENFINSSTADEILKVLETPKEIALTFTFAGGFMYFITPKKLKSFADLSGMKCIFENKNTFYSVFMKPLNIKLEDKEITADDKTSEYCIEELGSDININLIKHNNSFTLTGHRVLARVLRVSKEALKELNETKQRIFLDSLKSYAKKERSLVYDETKTAVETLRKRGIEVQKWSNSDKDRELKTYNNAMLSLEKEIGDKIKAIKALR